MACAAQVRRLVASVRPITWPVGTPIATGQHGPRKNAVLHQLMACDGVFGLEKQFRQTFPTICDSIVLQGISLWRTAVKSIVRLLLLATTPALFGSVQQASAMQSTPQDSASPAQP